MKISLVRPSVPDVPSVLKVLAAWQSDDAPHQVHPGYIKWFSRLGIEATVQALRLWSIDDEPAALGFLDGPGLIRFSYAPEHLHNEKLAARICTDLADTTRGILEAGNATVETPAGSALRNVLRTNAWLQGANWIAYSADPTTIVDGGELPAQLHELDTDTWTHWAEVFSSAYRTPMPPDDIRDNTLALLNGEEGIGLLGCNEQGDAVSAVACWSLGEGMPGLIEPLAVRPDHRGLGHAKAMVRAAAQWLGKVGASRITVNAEAANEGALATYKGAGLTAAPANPDLYRI